MCPGIQKDWDRVPGLAEAMDSPVGISNYEHHYARKASRVLRDVRSGTVVFTQPDGPGTCSGAAQKPMYLACDHWRTIGVLDDIRVVLVVPTPTMFGMPLVDAELERKVAEYGIEVRYGRELVGVDPAARTVEIAGVDRARALLGPDHAAQQGLADADRETLRYDVLHAVPPQSAPDWLAGTGLTAPGDAGGFVEGDPLTLRHPRFPDVWALGDAAATTNSKSGGALRQQTTTVGEEPRRGAQGEAAAADVRRVLGVPVRGLALHRRVRRVRRPLPPEAHDPRLDGPREGAPHHVPRRPVRAAVGVLEPDPAGARLNDVVRPADPPSDGRAAASRPARMAA